MLAAFTEAEAEQRLMHADELNDEADGIVSRVGKLQARVRRRRSCAVGRVLWLIALLFFAARRDGARTGASFVSRLADPLTRRVFVQAVLLAELAVFRAGV